MLDDIDEITLYRFSRLDTVEHRLIALLCDGWHDAEIAEELRMNRPTIAYRFNRLILTTGAITQARLAYLWGRYIAATLRADDCPGRRSPSQFDASSRDDSRDR